MAERSKFQDGVVRRYYEHFDTIAIQRLSELVSDIYLSEGNKPLKLWEKVKSLLSRVAADDPEVAKILADKDVKALARLVNQLNAGAKSKSSTNVPASEPVIGEGEQLRQLPPLAPGSAGGAPPATPSAATTQASTTPSPEDLKRAMKAFRKRLKLTRLDDESKLGRVGNPMSGGKKSNVAAIMAPREFPKSAWDELVRQGKLRTTDGVFYELAQE